MTAGDLTGCQSKGNGATRFTGLHRILHKTFLSGVAEGDAPLFTTALLIQRYIPRLNRPALLCNRRPLVCPVWRREAEFADLSRRCYPQVPSR